MDNITKQNGNEVGRHQVEGQTIIINQQERRSTNGLGTAGFILALLGLIFSWVPGLGWVLWALYGHEIEMYTVEQGEKRDKRQ